MQLRDVWYGKVEMTANGKLDSGGSDPSARTCLVSPGMSKTLKDSKRGTGFGYGMQCEI